MTAPTRTNALRTEEDYNQALAEIEPYFDAVPEPGTARADRFDVLARNIAAYEAHHHLPKRD